MNDIQNKLKELVRDLRKQRLLPVIAVLVVAIIAVPMALKAGGQEPTPPTELAVALEPMLETEPVVLTQAPELRDFRERLDKYSKKNPFHQPTPPPVEEPEEDVAATETATGGSTATETGSVPTDTGAITPEIPTDDSSIDDGTTDTTDTTDDGTDTTDDGTDGTGSGDEVISYDIDIEIGKVGEERTVEGVQVPALLPDGRNPLLQFVSTDLQGTSAAFVVSPDVVGADGDGNCSPSPRDCQFLKLEVGDAERLGYSINGDTYRIKLLAITRRVDVLEKLSTAADDVVEPIGFATQWKTG